MNESQPIFRVCRLAPIRWSSMRDPKLFYTNIGEFPTEKWVDFNGFKEAIEFGEKIADMDNVVSIEEINTPNNAIYPHTSDHIGNLRLWYLAWATDKWIETNALTFSHLRFNQLYIQGLEVIRKFGLKYINDKYNTYSGVFK